MPLRRGPAGGPVERIVTGGGPNGLALGPDGALYVAQNGGVFGASGPAPAGVQIVSDRHVDYFATGMDAPNDLAFGPDGRLWVTDPRGETGFDAGESAPRGWLWACALDGSDPERIVEHGPVFINGLGFTGDARAARDGDAVVRIVGLRAGRGGGADMVAAAAAAHLRKRLARRNADQPTRRGMGRADRRRPHRRHRRRGGRRATLGLPAGSLPTNVCIGGSGELYVTAAHSQSLLRLRFEEGEPSLA